jgi:toxin CptA
LTLHNAPPVVYPLGRSRFLGALLLGAWLSGLFGILLWHSQGTGLLDWRFVLMGTTVLGAGIAAGIAWRGSSVGRLAWDGQVWRWESLGYQAGTTEYELCVLGDFQQLLLLRLEDSDHACLWLWAERRAMPERWLDLRRAIYSPRKLASSSWRHDRLHQEPLPAVAVSGTVQALDTATQKNP